MFMKITLFAFGAKCGGRAARGSVNTEEPGLCAAPSSSETIPEASSVPATPERRKVRRDGSSTGLMSLPRSIHVQHLVTPEHRPCVSGPRGGRSLICGHVGHFL